MPKRLTSYVSDGIARSSPLEGGPAYEAMMRGGGLIKDTWGGYLSRLLEYYEGQLSPEDAMSLLGLSSEMIHDPKVQMSGEYEYGDYEEGLRLLYESEAYEIFRPESIRLLTLFNTICEPWLVTDEEKDRQAELLEALIAHNEADIDHEGVSDDEWESYMKREVELRSREASVGSGISIPAAELAAAMLSATPVQPDTMSELWRTWINSVGNVLEDAPSDHPFAGDTSAGDVYIGLREIATIRRTLLDAKAETEEYVQEKMKLIKPVFFAPDIEDHPLITGKHWLFI